MPVSPPLCLQIIMSSSGSPTGNTYPVVITLLQPQSYMANGTTPASYDCRSVTVGMYVTNSLYGYVFKIKSVSNVSISSMNAVLEDIDGLNKIIDPSGGVTGGAPDNNELGYIFELNADGLPALTNLPVTRSPTFTDSVLGRFLFDKKTALLTEQFSVIVGSSTGSPSTIATSYDGNRWTAQSSTGPFTNGNDVAYNGSIWVAVGFANKNANNTYNSILSSTDGINWTARPTNAPSLKSIAWNGSIFVVVGNSTTAGIIFTSSDGISWTEITPPVTTNLTSVVWTGKKFIAAGVGSSSFCSSVDGRTWSVITLDTTSTTLVGSSIISKLASNGNARLIAGRNNQGSSINTILYSDNEGVTWTPATWTNSQFILLSFTKSGNNVTTTVSTTAINEVNTGATSITITAGSGTAPAAGNLGTFTISSFVVGSATITYVNASGSTQTGISANLQLNDNILNGSTDGIAWNGHGWIAVGSQVSTTRRTIATSPDGVTWTVLKNSIFTKGRGIEWNGNSWIACGEGTNTIATSLDGTTWTGLGSSIFSSSTGAGAYSVSSRKLKTLIPVQRLKSIDVHLRGTGKGLIITGNTNNTPYPRQVYIDGVLNNSSSGETHERGLYLTIIKASDLSVVSTTQYNTTVDTAPNAALALAAAINGLTIFQIGILTSYREWEGKVDQSSLRDALRRVGLTKLANNAYNDTSTPGRAYAAIFYGAGPTATSAVVSTRDVIERLHAFNSQGPVATISARLITDGTFASITGSNSTNVLYSANTGIPVTNINGQVTILSTVNPVVEVDVQGAVNINSTISNQGLKVFTPSPFSDISPVPSLFKAQLQIYPKDNPNSRLYLGNYYTSGAGSISAIQSSDAYVNAGTYRDNPLVLSLNPLLGSNNLPGAVTVGKLNPESGTTLDVNGYIRGKGSVINTVCLKGSNNDQWNFFADKARPISYTYTPVQSGNVNIVVHGGTEMALLDGYGNAEAIAFRIAVRRLVPVARIAKNFGGAGTNWLVILSSNPVQSFLNGLNIINNVTTVTITAGGSISAQNAGTFTITASGIISPTANIGVFPGYYLQYNNSNSVDVSTGGGTITTVSLKTGEHLKYIWQGYNASSSYGSESNRETAAKREQQLSKGQDVMYVTTGVPATFYLEFDRGTDDTSAYRNAYMVLQEISTS
jgi:hypothetical protein